MVIFGAAGDLTKRKLIPALYNLARDSLLSKEFAVVGMARPVMSTEEARQRMNRAIHEFATEPVEPDLWEWFLQRLYYIPGEFQDPKAYRELRSQLQKVEKEHGTR